MKVLENRIIEDIKSTILDEEFHDLKENGKLDEHFQNELEIFKTFKKFDMNKTTKKYIDLYEEIMSKIAEENFAEEKLLELRENFKKYDDLEIIEKYEKLSFSIYHYYKDLYERINEKTAEEKEKILNETSLIHNYLRSYSFTVTADAVADVKLACKSK
jgi:hypothetical protein